MLEPHPGEIHTFGARCGLDVVAFLNEALEGSVEAHIEWNRRNCMQTVSDKALITSPDTPTSLAFLQVYATLSISCPFVDSYSLRGTSRAMHSSYSMYVVRTAQVLE